MESPVAQRDVQVRGVELDGHSRCAHYHGPTDVIAIRLHCCDPYYACRACHDELAGHEAATIPAVARDLPSVRCGACSALLSVRQYQASSDICPHCGAGFNPRCRLHYHLYFAPE